MIQDMITSHNDCKLMYPVVVFKKKFQFAGEEKNELYPTGACAATIDWTLQMDRHFIDLMLEQVHGGNKIDDTFNEQAWVHIITSFNEIFGLQDGKYELKNRYMVLMKQCDDINRILNQSGFAWDETRCTVVADDDVWDAYIKVVMSIFLTQLFFLCCCALGQEKDVVFALYSDMDVERMAVGT